MLKKSIFSELKRYIIKQNHFFFNVFCQLCKIVCTSRIIMISLLNKKWYRFSICQYLFKMMAILFVTMETGGLAEQSLKIPIGLPCLTLIPSCVFRCTCCTCCTCVYRDTPTAAGPNSFGKGRLGFCNRQQAIQKDLGTADADK